LDIRALLRDSPYKAKRQCSGELVLDGPPHLVIYSQEQTKLMELIRIKRVNGQPSRG
jgi:hypothetical protein